MNRLRIKILRIEIGFKLDCCKNTKNMRKTAIRPESKLQDGPFCRSFPHKRFQFLGRLLGRDALAATVSFISGATTCIVAVKRRIEAIFLIDRYIPYNGLSISSYRFQRLSFSIELPSKFYIHTVRRHRRRDFRRVLKAHFVKFLIQKNGRLKYSIYASESPRTTFQVPFSALLPAQNTTFAGQPLPFRRSKAVLPGHERGAFKGQNQCFCSLNTGQTTDH